MGVLAVYRSNYSMWTWLFAILWHSNKVKLFQAKIAKSYHVDDVVNGISENHGGQIEKGWRNFCKKSPFGFHLE